jgi:hypothetical protein
MLNAQPKLKVSCKLEKTKIQTGDTLRGILFLENTGTDTLKIFNMEASCGCTTFNLKDRIIDPGKNTTLFFIIDTAGKLGFIDKTITIFSNDIKSPWTEHITFHAMSSGEDKINLQKIFEIPCARCHIDPASGEEREALFNAICDMCHHIEDLYTTNKDSLYKFIAEGNEDIGMPAYKDFLSKEQILSLIRYLIGP